MRIFRTSIQLNISSFVPRSSHYPVFDHLQKWRRRPGPFYHMNDISVYLGRQREGPPLEELLFAHTFLCFEPEVVCFSLHEHSKLQHLGQKLHDKASSSPQACSFFWLVDWCHSRDKIYQVFPLRFCILQASINWTVGRPGNGASTSQHVRTNSIASFLIFGDEVE